MVIIKMPRTYADSNTFTSIPNWQKGMKVQQRRNRKSNFKNGDHPLKKKGANSATAF